jgi:acyl-CoA thioesterase FadM
MKPGQFIETRKILFGECDPAGILYTPRICEYVVESALLFLTMVLDQPFERFIFSQSMSLPARNIDVDFLKPLTWDDKIDLYAKVCDVRKHAYTIEITALNDAGETAFAGRITQVCISTENKSLAPIPDRLRAALEQTGA